MSSFVVFGIRVWAQILGYRELSFSGIEELIAAPDFDEVCDDYMNFEVPVVVRFFRSRDQFGIKANCCTAQGAMGGIGGQNTCRRFVAGIEP